MSAFQALVLGIVEGLTEFLPISSTGHLILAAKLLGLAQTEFQKSFEIVIRGRHGAVDVPRAWAARAWRGVTAARGAARGHQRELVVYPLVKTYLLGNESVVLLALFLGGLILIVFEVFYRKPAGAPADIKSITYLQAIGIGLFQAVAIVPGVSRSGATIVGGLAMGLNRETIVEFSFLLAANDDRGHRPRPRQEMRRRFQQDRGALAAGPAAAFIISFSIKFLLAYVRTRTFIAFGVYRIIAAVFLCWSADRVAIATLIKTPTGEESAVPSDRTSAAREDSIAVSRRTVPVAVQGRRFVSAFQKIHEEATRIVGDTDLVVRQDKFTQSFVVVGLSRANRS
jgi:undecaprenyl-diphosphatase